MRGLIEDGSPGDRYPERRELEIEFANLLLRYRDAVQACDEVPFISLWPLLRLYFQYAAWCMCIAFAPLVLLIDAPLAAILWLLKRRPFLVGRFMYRFLASPFRGVWKGEISAFQVIRIRSFTRVLVLFHARARTEALHRAFNLWLISRLNDRDFSNEQIEDLSGIDNIFELFGRITKARFQVGGAIAISGPMIAAGSWLAQEYGVPTINWLFAAITHGRDGTGAETGLDTSNAIMLAASVFVCVVWLFVSVWIDCRRILKRLGLAECERRAMRAVGAGWKPEPPLDLIGYCAFMLVYCALGLWPYFRKDITMPTNQPEDLRLLLTYVVLIWVFFEGLGIVAWWRRLRQPDEQPSGVAEKVARVSIVAWWIRRDRSPG